MQPARTAQNNLVQKTIVLCNQGTVTSSSMSVPTQGKVTIALRIELDAPLLIVS